MSYTAKDLAPLVRGDDWKLRLVITENNQPIDITGYEYWFTLKSNIDSADPGQIQVIANPSGVDATNGIVNILVSHYSTYNIPAGTYHYDVQQIDIFTQIKTILLGKVRVVKDVTRNYN